MPGVLAIALCGFGGLAGWPAAAALPATAVSGRATADGMDAEQIVARNAEARGGLERWRAIHSMVWTGHLEGARADLPLMQFVLSQARPNRVRFDVDAMGERSVRVFDGFNGWKQKPGRGGQGDVQPFSIQEVRFAQDEPVIDGPLIDSAARGSRVVLAGIETQGGRPAYRLDVQRRSGAHETVWVDTATFLETRQDRISYSQSGQPVTVSVYPHDWREFEGVRIPVRLDIGGTAEAPANRMVIERVVINGDLDAHAFSAPDLGHRRQTAAGPRGARTAPPASELPPAWALAPDPGGKTP